MNDSNLFSNTENLQDLLNCIPANTADLGMMSDSDSSQKLQDVPLSDRAKADLTTILEAVEDFVQLK